MSACEFDVRIQWHEPAARFAAVLLRDGQPWPLRGALVGMGTTRDAAVADLAGIGRHLVVHGANELSGGPIGAEDRQWLACVLDSGAAMDQPVFRAAWEAAQSGGSSS
jgi:hypothetical protein